MGGRGRGRLIFQLLILAPNLLKSQIPYVFVGQGGRRVSQLLILSAKLPKTQPKLVMSNEGGEGW